MIIVKCQPLANDHPKGLPLANHHNVRFAVYFATREPQWENLTCLVNMYISETIISIHSYFVNILQGIIRDDTPMFIWDIFVDKR